MWQKSDRKGGAKSDQKRGAKSDQKRGSKSDRKSDSKSDQKSEKKWHKKVSFLINFKKMQKRGKLIFLKGTVPFRNISFFGLQGFFYRHILTFSKSQKGVFFHFADPFFFV